MISFDCFASKENKEKKEMPISKLTPEQLNGLNKFYEQFDQRIFA
jgi:hypothetical protein